MINDIAASDAPGLDEYLKALWRRKYYVVALTIIGLIVAALYAGSLSRHYTASSEIIVGKLPTDNAFVPQSMEAERATLTGNDNIDQALATAGTNLTRGEVQQSLDVTFTPDSNVLRVAVSAPDAESAQKIANAIANAYQTDRNKKQQTYYESQITALNAQIAQLYNGDAANPAVKGIAALTIERADLETARNNAVRAFPQTNATQDQAEQLFGQIAIKQQEIESLKQQYNDALSRRSDLTSAAATAPPPAVIARTARTPAAPDGLSDNLLLAIGLLTGLLVGAAVALFLDRFDGTIRGENDVAAILGTPVLATVPSFPRNSASNGLVMLRATTGRRPAAARDSYRRLRSTLEFLAKRSDLKSFLVTSPRPGDGKSTTVVNLAIAAAQTGRKVAIVSADLHRPSIERLLSLPTQAGLSEYLLDESEAILAEVPSIPNLTVITSGRPVETPAELLASGRVSELVKLLEENHDLVLFDTPPVLNASDSLALASRVDGVIVVCDSRSTNSADLEQLRDDTQLVGARIIGSVLNHHRLGLKRNTYAYGPTRRLEES
jgi:capsular exopolysaccharide synthesis family protein